MLAALWTVKRPTALRDVADERAAEVAIVLALRPTYDARVASEPVPDQSKA
jgi:hypothetical protein